MMKNPEQEMKNNFFITKWVKICEKAVCKSSCSMDEKLQYGEKLKKSLCN